MIVELNANDDQLRTLMLDAVGGCGDTRQLFEVVAGLAVKRGLAKQGMPSPSGIVQMGPRNNLTGFVQGEVDLCNADRVRVLDCFWDLFIEGIVRHGSDIQNYKLPWFHVTERGRKLIREKTPSPFD